MSKPDQHLYARYVLDRTLLRLLLKCINDNISCYPIVPRFNSIEELNPGQKRLTEKLQLTPAIYRGDDRLKSELLLTR